MILYSLYRIPRWRATHQLNLNMNNSLVAFAERVLRVIKQWIANQQQTVLSLWVAKLTLCNNKIVLWWPTGKTLGHEPLSSIVGLLKDKLLNEPNALFFLFMT